MPTCPGFPTKRAPNLKRRGRERWAGRLQRAGRRHAGDEVEILLEVVALEPRMIPAPVALGKIFGAFELARQKTSSDRTVRYEADSQLAHRREDFLFHVATPQRILGLQRRNRMHAVRAANRLRRAVR